MLEDSTNEKDRIREAARALVKEYRRKHNERIMSEATVATCNRLAGQVMLTPEGKEFFRGIKNNREETEKDSSCYTRETEIPGFPGVCVRFLGEHPHYIK